VDFLKELGMALHGFLEAARGSRPLPLAPLEPLAARLVDRLAAGDDLMVVALDVREGQGSLAAHCTRPAG